MSEAICDLAVEEIGTVHFDIGVTAVQNVYESAFKPGDAVIVGDDVPGVVERITFARNMTKALILVEWWDRSDVRSREFHEDDLRHQVQPED